MGNANIYSIAQYSFQFGISCFSLQSVAGVSGYQPSSGRSTRDLFGSPSFHFTSKAEWSSDLPQSLLGWSCNGILVLQFLVWFLTPRGPLSCSASYIISLTKNRYGTLEQGLRVDGFHEKNLKALTHSSGNQKADHSKESRNQSPISLCQSRPG